VTVHQKKGTDVARKYSEKNRGSERTRKELYMVNRGRGLKMGFSSTKIKRISVLWWKKNRVIQQK